MNRLPHHWRYLFIAIVALSIFAMPWTTREVECHYGYGELVKTGFSLGLPFSPWYKHTTTISHWYSDWHQDVRALSLSWIGLFVGTVCLVFAFLNWKAYRNS
jgi:hypothetical protein